MVSMALYPAGDLRSAIAGLRRRECACPSRRQSRANSIRKTPAGFPPSIDAMMCQAAAPEMEPPVALVVPHAGYAYSGQICADAFRLASRFSFDRIIILGTNHTDSDFQGISVFDAGEFETPLGRIPVDEEMAKKLVSAGKPVTADRRGASPGAFDRSDPAIHPEGIS